MNDFVNTSALTGASHIDDQEDDQSEIPVEEMETPRRKTPRIVARLFEAVLVLRDFFFLLIGLLLDERVDRKVKIFVGSVIAYIISPIDFIPDLLGGLFGLADDFVLTSTRQNEAVVEAIKSLQAASDAVMRGVPHEMVLLDLYNALGALNELTGEVVSEDILDRIFSTFCIGK